MGPPCCPPGSHGEAVPVEDEETVGVEKITKNGMEYYEVGDGSDVVLMCTDVFGWKSGRHRVICDFLAKEAGFHVFMPDYFHGKPAAVVPKGPFNILSNFTEQTRLTLQAPRMLYRLKMYYTEDNVVNKDILADMVPTIKEQLGEDIKLACFGFCFGGWVIGKLAATEQFACAVSCHPSFQPEILHGGTEESVAKAVLPGKPILLMPAGNDSKKLYPGGKCLEIWGDTSKSIAFENMKHGWVTRGDRRNEEIKMAQDQAVENTMGFITEVFSTL